MYRTEHSKLALYPYEGTFGNLRMPLLTARTPLRQSLRCCPIAGNAETR